MESWSWEECILPLAFIDTDNFIVGSPTGGIWRNRMIQGTIGITLTDNLSNIDVWSSAIESR